MRRPPPGNAADLRGISRLTVTAVAGVVDMVEAMHHHVSVVPRVAMNPPRDRATGVARVVYRSIHGVVALVGNSLDILLARLGPLLGAQSAWPGRAPLLAALNGVVGDHLAASDNPLAITMALRRKGEALPRERAALAAGIPDAASKVVVLVHGLCMSDVQWQRKGHDHGAALARDLGYTPVYLHYNSGLHISTNGRAFADELEALVAAWPVPLTELVIIGHSMGGLVARSACHYGNEAGHAWPQRLRKLVFLGTPHHGAPLERGGNWVDVILGMSRYSAPLARIGKIRSASITDLRHGNLVDEDWQMHDRFARRGDARVPMPLPPGVACFAIGGTTGKAMGDLSSRLLGDGIVPLGSALGRHADPRRSLAFTASRQWVAQGTRHLDLLKAPQVYDRIRRWLVP